MPYGDASPAENAQNSDTAYSRTMYMTESGPALKKGLTGLS